MELFKLSNAQYAALMRGDTIELPRGYSAFLCLNYDNCTVTVCRNDAFSDRYKRTTVSKPTIRHAINSLLADMIP